MIPLRYSAFWWLIGVGLVSLVVYASLATGGPVMTITLWDKLQHMGAYCVLGVYFSGLVTPRWHRWVVLALFLMGAVLEWLQLQGGVRVFSWADVLGNAVGLAVAVLLAWLGLRHWSEHIERLLA